MFIFKKREAIIGIQMKYSYPEKTKTFVWTKNITIFFGQALRPKQTFFNFGGANIEIRQRAYQLLDILSIFIVGTLFSILPVRFGVAWPLAEIEDFASSN